MAKETKRLLTNILIIFIGMVLFYPLPHDSYSVIRYVFPPIELWEGATLYIWGLIPIVMILVGANGVSKYPAWKDKSKILIYLVIFLLVLPLMVRTMDTTRTAYHWIKNDRLQALDIEYANVNIVGIDDEISLNFDIIVKNYGKQTNEFKLRVYIPEDLQSYVDQNSYEFENVYKISPYQKTFIIQESINGQAFDRKNYVVSFQQQWSGTIIFEFYNETESVQMIQHFQDL